MSFIEFMAWWLVFFCLLVPLGYLIRENAVTYSIGAFIMEFGIWMVGVVIMEMFVWQGSVFLDKWLTRRRFSKKR
jgi:hypothetical protein